MSSFQTTRKPPTPEEIIAKQKGDAVRQKHAREHPEQAPLPDIIKATVPAMPDNRSAAEKTAD